MMLLLLHQLENILDNKNRRKSVGREGGVFLVGSLILIERLVLFFVGHHNDADFLDEMMERRCYG